MAYDPLAPSNGVPPREVREWTQVDGHIVVADRPRAFCSCGARPPRDWQGTGAQWRSEHLRDAWPILVPRLDGEDLAHWLTRVSDEYVRASAAEDEAYQRGGRDRPIREGKPYPVITEDLVAASERVEVLERQMNDVRARVQGRLRLDA